MIETIANRIFEARKLAGLSPAQAAKMLSLPTDRILEIEQAQSLFLPKK